MNVYGAVYMAGFSAAGKIQNIITMVAVSIGATIATYVGQNRGAGRMDRVQAGVKCSWIMLLIWAAIEMVVMYFGGRYFTYLFIDPSETAVVEVSVTYFRTVFWAYPFLCTIFLFRNALQGMVMGWFLCLAEFLNWLPELLSFFLLQENQLCRNLYGRSGSMDRCPDSSDPILLLYNEKI